MHSRHLSSRRSRAGALLIFAACATSALAQSGAPDAFVEAQRAEARGDYSRAEELYSQATQLETHADEALLGRARMRSWLGRFDEAIVDYRAVIARDPKNPRALSGLGWTYAWNRSYDDARQVFEHLAEVEPYYLDARKGLAYVDLWRGNAGDARRQFEELAREDQGNTDYLVAIGQAAYLQGDLPAARTAFREALALKPGLEAARSGLEAVDAAALQRRPSVMVLLGRSSAGDVDHSGVRLAQVSIQTTPRARWWLTYDRGVGFDGLSPDRRRQNAATTTIGGFFNFTPRTGTRLEAGIRDLPDDTQPVIAAEQVFFLPGGTTPKIGLWAADGESATEWVVNVGVHRSITSRFALEPMVYFGDDGQSQELRGSLLGTYRFPRGVEAGIGFALGTKDTDGGDRSVNRIFGNLAVPISERLRFLFYAWREDTEGFDDQTVLAAGVSANL